MDEHCRGCIRYRRSCAGMSKRLCEKYQLRIPITNADRIRAMTDEELADYLYNTVDDFPPWCDERRGHHGEPNGCKKCMVDWLKEEAQDD